MDKNQFMECATDLRSDLKYAFEQGEGQTPNHKDVKIMDWLIEQAEQVEKWKRSEAIAVNLLNKYAKELEEARGEIEGFKEFLRYASDIDKRMDALVETQQNEIRKANAPRIPTRPGTSGTPLTK